MKKRIFLLIMVGMLFTPMIYAQVSVNGDGTPADSSAMLDIQSTNKGFLPPRMTINQMNSIQNPSAGLEVYNTDLNSPCYYNGEEWINSETIEGNVYSILIYDIGPFENIDIGHGMYELWYAMIPGLEPGYAVSVNPQGNPNNGGNMIFDGWTTIDTLFIRESNVGKFNDSGKENLHCTAKITAPISTTERGESSIQPICKE